MPNEHLQSIAGVAHTIKDLDKKLILIYGFNGVGKTQLSVAFKDVTKDPNNGNHTGVYYNAYSEDLFSWDNDEENDGQNIRLMIKRSTLNQYHSLLDKDSLRQKLSLYKPKYDFALKFYDDVALGIESVQFFMNTEDDTAAAPTEFIKVSRGEERIFIWCFFLALFEVEGWTSERSGHFFIDDPVSSLDDHNIFVTAASLINLIDNHFKDRKIVITTHHIGLFAILADWLGKGEKADSYKKSTQLHILKREGNTVSLLSPAKDVFLYHLELLQTLKTAIDNQELYAYHFALLRQVLENISSFLGVGRVSFVLEQIGITDPDEVNQILNTLSHKTVFRYEAKELVEDNVRLFNQIFSALMSKYNFVIH
ncbi:MAG: anticodon nuclease [Chloroflexi bacterium HGW-Chloroflexi-6]|nr:MAG: anticodon nuclease [Chloroflexi bacterium HGW-Chloroflexi-6]